MVEVLSFTSVVYPEHIISLSSYQTRGHICSDVASHWFYRCAVTNQTSHAWFRKLVSVWINICSYVCVHVCVCVGACMHVCVCLGVCVCVCPCV